ncbi:short subunit dehydrogenase [Kribbella sp. VKM Ac-2527]|uniref:Short subunit dehydrogenase n=1 Tax=Kribbella caucasensis TaxID=2512215 RepID=A0A4R6KI16_9ACTN|nr:short subunit dehydrogenase [Kribbella sp. VKM Ac-2527]
MTGAGQRIGRELGRRFSADGATTYLIDLDRDLLEEAAGHTAGHPLLCDVSSTADVERVVETVVNETGRLDVVSTTRASCATEWSGSSPTTIGTPS